MPNNNECENEMMMDKIFLNDIDNAIQIKRNELDTLIRIKDNILNVVDRDDYILLNKRKSCGGGDVDNNNNGDEDDNNNEDNDNDEPEIICGIGMHIQKYPNSKYVSIKKVMVNSSAQNVGLTVKDLIVKINEKDMAYKEVDMVKRLIMGKENTSINLAIMRNDEIFDVTVKRKYLKM